MSKMKTNRGAAKRFRRTGKGGYKRGQSHLNHILTKKSSKRKRHLGSTEQIAGHEKSFHIFKLLSIDGFFHPSDSLINQCGSFSLGTDRRVWLWHNLSKSG